MASKKKLFDRIMASPPKKDIKYNEVETLLLSKGYEKIEGKGSRITFYNKQLDDIIDFLHKPHGDDTFKVYMIRKLQKKLREISDLI